MPPAHIGLVFVIPLEVGMAFTVIVVVCIAAGLQPEAAPLLSVSV